ncbi:MAG: metallophosphatase domain-containing protein [Candidatus Kariarchaeaceae archaeon]|jgi:Icc-related predicted phosphoesterase
MRLLNIADTHSYQKNFINIYGNLPEADIIIHAGDLTNWGGRKELKRFARWWNELPYEHKILIAGNHDFCLYDYPEMSELLDGHYLLDSSVTINGIKFWGSPWTPKFGNWTFMIDRFEINKKWNKIPSNVDILITHGPPFGYGDFEIHTKSRVGCEHLYEKILEIQPKLHICGHIHEDFGIRRIKNTTTINASSFLGLTNNPQPAWVVFDI